MSHHDGSDFQEKSMNESARSIEFFGGDDISHFENARITRGAFGEISLAVHADRQRRQVVAIKTLFRSHCQNGSTKALVLSQALVEEVAALRGLGPHENIVTLLAVYPSRIGSSISLAFEYCPTDLALALDWRRRTFLPLLDLDVIRTVAHDVFAALQHVHASGFVHLDVTPANLLVSVSGYVRLCDFGLARTTAPPAAKEPDEGRAFPRGLCALPYRPPEVLLGAVPAQASADMYSVGTVLCELLLGRPFLVGPSVLAQLNRVFAALGTPSAATWPTVQRDAPDYAALLLAAQQPRPWAELLPRAGESPDLADILGRLVVLEPARRLSAAEAVGHAWLRPPPDGDADGAARRRRRRRLVESLVPEPLEAPLLLSVPGDPAQVSDVAMGQVQALAAARRRFLSDLVPTWRDASVEVEGTETGKA